MKQKLFALMAALCAAQGTIAQDKIIIHEDTVPDVRDMPQFGVKAGINFSNVYSSSGESFHSDSKAGVALGGFLAVPLNRYLGIQPEVLFSQKGFHATGRLLGSTYELTRTTNYIDVPLYFAFKPSQFLTILAGPQYSYLMKQTDVFKNATTSIEQERQFENDNIRKNTLSFVIGADVNLKHVALGVRGGWDVQNNNGDGSSSTPRYKNQWFQATLAYRFFY